MSRAAFATPEQVEANFAKCIKDALELGLWPPSDQGFYNETSRALTKLAQAYPEASGDLVAAAKSALAAQLSAMKAPAR